MSETAREAVREYLKGALGEGGPVAVLLVSLDRRWLEGSDAALKAESFLDEGGTEILRRSLRRVDQLARLDPGRYLLFLHETREAGAELVAWRIKRELSLAAQEALGTPLPFKVGRFWRERAAGVEPEEILYALERSLEEEEACQPFFVPSAPSLYKDLTGPVYAAGLDGVRLEALKAGLSPYGHRIFDFETPGALKGFLDALEAEEAGVAVLDGKAEEIESLIEKIRINRKLDCIFLISLQKISGSKGPHSPDLVLQDAPLERLIEAVLRGYQEVLLRRILIERTRVQGVLEAIGAHSHRLNQPLQIILGRVEALLMGIEADPERMRASLEVIKKEALRAGDINTKLNRLTHYFRS